MEIIIDCKGVVMSGINIPHFKLVNGEYLTLEILFDYDFLEEKKIINLFSKRYITDEMNIYQKISVVEDINIEKGIIKRFTKNISCYNYLLQNTNYESKEILNLLNVVGINPVHKIWSLGSNGRKILSLEVALTKGRVIMINTIGLDYNGLEFIRERLKTHVDNNGSVIELNYKSNKDIKSVPYSKKIKLEKIAI